MLVLITALLRVLEIQNAIAASEVRQAELLQVIANFSEFVQVSIFTLSEENL